jgi:hypothetical protein
MVDDDVVDEDDGRADTHETGRHSKNHQSQHPIWMTRLDRPLFAEMKALE